jgi:transposase-like protein
VTKNNCKNSLTYQRNNLLRNSIAQCDGNFALLSKDKIMIQVNQFKNVLEVLDFFKEEETCRLYLEQQRWNGKVTCPHCGHTHVYRTNRGFKCASKECSKKFSVLVGTPMEHTKIKLRLWFAAVYVLSAHKKGISSHQLGRDLGISQKCAWFLNMRIRQMFIDPAPEKLTMVVQCDETFVGGKNKNRHKDKKVKNSQGRSFKDKRPVLGIMQPGGTIKTFQMPNTAPETIQPLLEQNVEKGAFLMSDEWCGYDLASTHFCHLAVNHKVGQYVDGMVTCNGVENFWSHLKRGLTGIYHHVSFKHLNKYCLEYSYRFNTRKVTNEERFHSVLTNANNNRLSWKTLVNDNRFN